MTDIECIDERPKIVQGSSKTLTLRFRKKNGDIYVITGATVLTVKFPHNTVGTFVSKTLAGGVTITDGPNGVATVALTTTDTGNMKPDPNTTFYATVTVGSVTEVVEFTNAVQVIENPTL